MHELGHVLLHKNSTRRCQLSAVQGANVFEEQEANAFMRAALLPDSILDLAIRYICDLYGIDTRHVYEIANSTRGRHIWREKLFANLINILCVSREMISLAMKQRSVFNNETVEYHKTYALADRLAEFF